MGVFVLTILKFVSWGNTNLKFSLFYEKVPEKVMAPHSQYSCLENPMDGGAW